MATPTNRTPVRIARGSTSALTTGISDIQEGEIVWDTTTNRLKVKEGVALEESNPPSATAMLDVDQTWTGVQRGTISTLTSPDSNTVTIDFDVANNFQMTPTHGCTFDQPSNQTAGQSGSIFLEQGVGAPFTYGWHADYKWTGGTAPSTWSQTAGKVDRIDYIIRANGEIHCVASVDVFG